MQPTSSFEPTLLGAAWRYRWLVLAIVALFGALGYAVVATQSSESEWTATATVIVEDPAASTLFESGGVQRPDRYLENQVEILRSDVVAQRAADLAAQGDPPVSLEAVDLIDDGTIDATDVNDAIEISFRSTNKEATLVGANAMAAAYQDVRRSEAARNFSASIAQLDTSILESEAELADLQVQVDELLLGNTARQELERQFEEAIAELVQLQQGRSVATDETLDAVRAALDDVLQQMETLQLVLSVERSDSRLDVLIAQQQTTVNRLSILTARRDELEVDSELAGSGVVLFSPALEPELVGTGAIRSLAVAVVLGGLVAVGLAYALALRRREFSDHTQPELVLGAPMLAEVSDFREERIKGELPVTEAPFSAAAEGFRFVAEAVARRVGSQSYGRQAGPEEVQVQRREGGLRSITVVSSLPDQGKSIVTANLAMAMARGGNNVLVIDADFGDQRLSRLFGFQLGTQGLTEIIAGKEKLADVVLKAAFEEGSSLSMLVRGEVLAPAADLLRSDAAGTFFDSVRNEYDVVIIDTPPLLHVAYASTLVGYADAAIVAVPHGSSVSVAEELRNRFELVETPIFGYVYNRAPLRRKRLNTEGSMQDVIGTGWWASEK